MRARTAETRTTTEKQGAEAIKKSFEELGIDQKRENRNLADISAEDRPEQAEEPERDREQRDEPGREEPGAATVPPLPPPGDESEEVSNDKNPSLDRALRNLARNRYSFRPETETPQTQIGDPQGFRIEGYMLARNPTR